MLRKIVRSAAREPSFLEAAEATAAVLAGLMPSRNVVVAPTSGAAEGAAMLVRWGLPRAPPRLAPAQQWRIAGLEAYRQRWEQGL